MSKLLAVDLDKTLFYPKQFRRCISRKNVKFLRKWYDAGNQIVLITSRTYDFVKKLEKEIQRPFDCLSCNSAQIHHNGEIIKDVWLPNDEFKKIFNEIDEKYKPMGYLLTAENYPCVIYNPRKVGFFFLIICYLYYFFQFQYREKSFRNNKLFLDLMDNSKCYKLMTFFGWGRKKKDLSKEINKTLREKYPEIESSWSLIVNELTPRGCNKGDGLEDYCKRLNINKEDVIVVGDSGNDISMFQKYYENSFCMSHAYPSVKKYARHTVTRVYKLDKFVLKGEDK